jgi:hypothetical protein
VSRSWRSRKWGETAVGGRCRYRCVDVDGREGSGGEPGVSGEDADDEAQIAQTAQPQKSAAVIRVITKKRNRIKSQSIL